MKTDHLSGTKCENCGEPGVHQRHISRSYGAGADLLVVENIPATSCPHCGAVYLSAETLHEIDRIKAHRKSLSKRRPVAVAEFI